MRDENRSLLSPSSSSLSSSSSQLGSASSAERSGTFSSSSTSGIFGIDLTPLQEVWSRINFTYKMSALALVTFGPIIIFLCVLVSFERVDISAIHEREAGAKFCKQLGRVYISLENEAIVSLGNARWALSGGRDELTGNSVPAPVSKDDIARAQLGTDLDLKTLVDSSRDSPLASSIMKRLFRSTVLADTRQKINYATLTGAQLQPRRVDYNVLLRDVANAFLRVSISLTSPELQSQLAIQSALMSIAAAYPTKTLSAGRDIIRMGPMMSSITTDRAWWPNVTSPSLGSGTGNSSSYSGGGVSAAFVAQFRDRTNVFLNSLYSVELMTRLWMSAGAGGEVLAYRSSRSALTRGPWRLADALAESQGGIWRRPDINLSVSTNSRKYSSPEKNSVVSSIVSRLPDGAFTDLSKTRERSNEVIFGIMIGLAGIALIYMFICWVHHLHATEINEFNARNAAIMHVVSVRVAEFVDAFATFSLVVPPPSPLLRGASHASVVESELQQCLASLRTLAPAMPPLLFPTLFAKMAAAVSEVNDSRSVVDRIALAVVPNGPHTGRRAAITLLQHSDVSPLENNIYFPPMEALTTLSACVTNAVVVTVDAFFFHDVCNPRKRASHTSSQQHATSQLQRERWAQHAHHRFVSCVEECVYQYGGVVHFAGLDRVTAVWLLDNSSDLSGGATVDSAQNGVSDDTYSHRGRVGIERRRRGGGLNSSRTGGSPQLRRRALSAPMSRGGWSKEAAINRESGVSTPFSHGSKRSGGPPQIGIFTRDEYERILESTCSQTSKSKNCTDSSPINMAESNPLMRGADDGEVELHDIGSPSADRGVMAANERNLAPLNTNVPSSSSLLSRCRQQVVVNMAPFLRSTFTPVYTSRDFLGYGHEDRSSVSTAHVDSKLNTNRRGARKSRSSSAPPVSSSIVGGAAKEGTRAEARSSLSFLPHSGPNFGHSLGGIHEMPRHQRGFRAPNACDAPAMCALAIAGRLAELSRTSSGGINDPFKLWSSVPIHVGVTAGPILFGTFGFRKEKTVQVFGEAILNGISVARVNQYALTSVTCDELVKRVIETHRYCKAVDSLPGIGRVYEVLPPQAVLREGDVEAKLAAYNAAYDWYEGGFLREALHAFRAYTKQYGYDRSVERLQGMITGL